MKLRWMLGCLVLCAAACKTAPPPIPGATPGNPDGVCRRTPPTGTAILGATLVHGATFYMLMIEACGTDVTKLNDAARACVDRSDCGTPLSPAGLTEVNDALSSTMSPVVLGGGPAFLGRTATRTLVVWDASRNPLPVLAAVNQASSAPAAPGPAGPSCCPGCTACDPASGAQCAGTPPRVDKAPAPGFLPLPGPAVCACDTVCAAKANKQVPDTCDCAKLCQCP